MLPPLLNEVPGFLSGQLLKIKMRGKLGDVRFEKELIPSVTEPVRRVFGGSSRMRSCRDLMMPQQ